MYKYRQIFYKRKGCKEKTVCSTGKIKDKRAEIVVKEGNYS